MKTNNNINDALISLKNYYGDFLLMTPDNISDIYSHDVRFKDPMHTIEGIAPVTTYFENTAKNLLECRFSFLDETVSENKAFLKWDMNYRHAKLANGNALQLRGVTQLDYSGSHFYYHEDIYDVGAMLYEHLPLIGLATRFLKKRVGS